MSLYKIPFYTKSFYGTDINGGPPGGIFGLNAYQNTSNSVVVYWRYDPCSATSNLFTWTVETDLVPTFDSVNLRSYSSVANPEYIAGGVNRGLVVQAYKRQQGIPTPMYWRVQGHYSSADTAYTSSVFMIPEAIDDLVRQEMLDTLTDQIYKKDFAAGMQQLQSLVFDGPLSAGNVFSVTIDDVPLAPISYAVSNVATMTAIAAAIKSLPQIADAQVMSSGLEILVKAKEKDVPVVFFGPSVSGGIVRPQVSVEQRNSTNLNRLFKIFGVQMDKVHMDLTLVQNDLFTQSVRDASLVKNFSSMLGIRQPSTMSTIDFREIVRAMYREAGGTPSLGSIRRVLNTAYCEDPTFTLVRDTLGMYVDDPVSVPAVSPFYIEDTLSVPTVDPETIWDNQNLAFGIIIKINNPLGLSIPQDFIRMIVSKMAPIHSPVYVVF